MPPQAGIVSFPAGTILDHVGDSDMPVTTAKPKAKQLCRQGFALIHCFWFNEAIRSFRDAVKEDPTCPMAWCGLNLALTQPWATDVSYNAEAEYAIKRAIANIDKASEPEQDFIRAFRLRSIGEGDRDPAFARAMSAIVEKSDLNEPRLVWASLLCQRCIHEGYLPGGAKRGDLEFIAKLIAPVLKRDPNCVGALHYAIHAYEPMSPQKAVDAAKRLEKLAPQSAHLLHMPGHIFNRVGMYEEASKCFARSRAFDEKMAQTLGVAPGQADWQYGHNLQFLCLNLTEMGRLKEAEETSFICGWTDNLAWRQGDWSKLVGSRNWKTDSEANPTLRTVFRGYAALSQGDFDTGRTKLEAVRKYLSQPEEEKFNSSVETNRRILSTAADELEGSLLMKEGKVEEGIAKFKKSIATYFTIAYLEPPQYMRPPQEAFGYALIDAGRTEEAVQAFTDAFQVRPNSGWLYYGIALAQEKAGKAREAELAYTKFLAAWPDADANLPQMLHATQFLATAGHSKPGREPIAKS